MFRTRHNPLGREFRASAPVHDPDTIVYLVQGYNGTTTACVPEFDGNGTVDWGDGTTEAHSAQTESTASLSHQYSDGVATHVVTIRTDDTTQILSADGTSKSILEIRHLPQSLTSLSEFAYGGSTDDGLNPLRSVDLSGAVALQSIGASAFQHCSSLSSVALPSGLTTLGDKAFANCSSLRSLELPDSLTTMQTSQYGNPFFLSGLTSLRIPPKVAASDYPLAIGCQQMANLTVDPGNPNLWSEGNCIVNTSTGKVDTLCAVSVVPSSVKDLGDYCGAYMGPTDKWTLPSHVSTVGKYAFAYADATDVDFSQATSLSSIGEYCFTHANCQYIELPQNSSTTYGTYLCSYTDKLVELQMGGKQFGAYMFYTSSNSTWTTLHLYTTFSSTSNCSFLNTNSNVFGGRKGLKTIKYHGTMTQWNNTSALKSIFGQVSSNGSLSYTSGFFGFLTSKWYSNTTVTVQFV